MAQQRVNPQMDPTDEDAERIGTLGKIDTVMQVPEVVIGAVEEVYTPQREASVVIRVNQDVEQMTITAGGNMYQFDFKAGHQYRVPIQIAQELERTGRIWH